VQTALARRPADRRKLEDLQARMRAPDADRATIGGEMRAIYQGLGVDARVATACRRRGQTAGNGDPGSTGATRLATPTDGVAPDSNMRPVRTRPGLVFVAEGSTYKPRVVVLGAGNYDYTEVVSGLQEGERVALLASLAVQAQREQQNERFRRGMGGIPGMQQGGGGAQRGGGGGGGPR
jgi:HlyD family secretion protein